MSDLAGILNVFTTFMIAKYVVYAGLTVGAVALGVNFLKKNI